MLLSLNAHALPDPLTCGAEHPGSTPLIHSGNSLLTKGEVYETALEFPITGALTITTNFGPDFTETIDTNVMRDTTVMNVFPDANYACLRPDRVDSCAVSLANVLNTLATVEKRLRPGVDRANAHEVLSCARSIIVSFMDRAFASHDGLIAKLEDVRPRALTDEQVSAVTGRMVSIKKAQNAETMALLAVILASSSSSRRR